MILLFDTFWHVAQRLEEDYHLLSCYCYYYYVIVIVSFLLPSLSLSQDAEGQETTVEIDIAGEKVNMFYRDFRRVIIRHVNCIHVHVCVLVVLLLYISFL